MDDVFYNLAVDEALARVCASSEEKKSTLRFWKTKSAVVIGRFQCVHEEVNLSYCLENDIAIARRFTGGGAVFHDDGNLNFVICGDQQDAAVSRILADFYEVFVGAVVRALRSLNIPAEYDKTRNCIRSNGRKVTGTAGWIKRGVSFLHGTLLVNADLDMLRCALDPPAGQPVYLRDRTRIRCKPSERDHVTNLVDETEDKITQRDVINAIRDSVQAVIGQEVEAQKLTPEEKTASERLYQERYSQPSWNLGIRAQQDQ